MVLGRGGGMIQQIYLPFFLGTGGRMGNGSQPMPWIHVKDLSSLILHCVQKPEVEGVVNGVAPELISNQQFVDAFAGVRRHVTPF